MIGVGAVNDREIKALCDISALTNLNTLYPTMWGCEDGKNTSHICPYRDEGINNWVGVKCNFSDPDISVYELNLSYIKMNGSIPDSISLLDKMTVFGLSSSEVSGTIPTALADIPTLEYIDLSRNNLYGTLPEVFASHPKLSQFDVSINQLTGTIPEVYGDWKILSTIALHMNKLTGTIPASLGNLPGVDGWFTGWFYNNPFTGRIPDTFCNIPVENVVLYFAAYYNTSFVETLECYPACLNEIKNLEVGTIPVCADK